MASGASRLCSQWGKRPLQTAMCFFKHQLVLMLLLFHFCFVCVFCSCNNRLKGTSVTNVEDIFFFSSYQPESKRLIRGAPFMRLAFLNLQSWYFCWQLMWFTKIDQILHQIYSLRWNIECCCLNEGQDIFFILVVQRLCHSEPNQYSLTFVVRCRAAGVRLKQNVYKGWVLKGAERPRCDH